jgi:hypothetical protein
LFEDEDEDDDDFGVFRTVAVRARDVLGTVVGQWG